MRWSRVTMICYDSQRWWLIEPPKQLTRETEFLDMWTSCLGFFQRKLIAAVPAFLLSHSARNSISWNCRPIWNQDASTSQLDYVISENNRVVSNPPWEHDTLSNHNARGAGGSANVNTLESISLVFEKQLDLFVREKTFFAALVGSPFYDGKTAWQWQRSSSYAEDHSRCCPGKGWCWQVR